MYRSRPRSSTNQSHSIRASLHLSPVLVVAWQRIMVNTQRRGGHRNSRCHAL